MDIAINIIFFLIGVIITHVYTSRSSDELRTYILRLENALFEIRQLFNHQFKLEPNSNMIISSIQDKMKTILDHFNVGNVATCPKCGKQSSVFSKQDHDALYLAFECPKCGYKEERLGAVI